RWEDRPAGPGRAEAPSSKLQAPRSRRGTGVLVLGIVTLLTLFPLRLFEVANPDWRPLGWVHAFAVITITFVVIYCLGGWPWVKHFSFPILFFLVAVPWISAIEQPIVQGLMRVVAAVATEAISLCGIPAQVEGSIIRVSTGIVGVNEACSGVRSLQTSLMIGLLFGELKRLSILRRIVLVIAAAAIAFVGNCIRAFFLVWVAATKNVAAANQWHDFAGYGIVGLVFIGSLALATLLGRRKVEITKAKVETDFKFEIRNSKFEIAAAIVWLLLVEVVAAGWYRAHEGHLAQTTRWEVQWPQSAPNFHEIKVDDDMRRILRFDQGHAASWILPPINSADASSAVRKSLSCTLYFFRWDSGKNSALLANLH